PGAAPAFARFRGDDVDWMVWRANGEPPAFRYQFDVTGQEASVARVEPYRPVRGGVVEAGALWPPRSPRGGWAAVEWAQGTFPPGARWLRIHGPVGSGGGAQGPAEITLDLPTPFLASIAPRIAASGGAEGELDLFADPAVVHVWHIAAGAD